MLLPPDRQERHPLYRNLIREVGASRADRKAVTRKRRQQYLTGSEGTQRARYNKLREHVQDLAADLYAPDSVRFSVVYPPHYGDRWLAEVEAARDEIHRLWHDSSAGLIFNLGVETAPSWGTTVFKTYVDQNEPVVAIVSPDDIAVARESLNDWDHQEALVHFYELTLDQFRRFLHPLDPARRAAIFEDAENHAAPSSASGTEALGPAMSRLILSAASPTMTGTVNMGAANPAQAMEQVPVVQMAELWVFDDEATPLCGRCHRARRDLTHDKDLPLYTHAFEGGGGWEGDYRVVTLVVGSSLEPIVWEPLNPLLAGEHPFHDLTIDPVYGYIWGLSQVEELYPLQEWRERRMQDVDELLHKQVDPPIVGTGLQGTQDEKLARLRKAGGIVSFPAAPGVKVEPFVVPMPPEAFAEVEKLDEMFDRAAGRRSRTRGPGMRSGDQVMAEARLAGGPTRNKAMIVEACLESVATALLRLQRRVSKSTLRTVEGKEVLLAQIPGDFVVRVSAHSSSPLYQEEIMQKVAFAASKGWIDADEALDLMNFPNAEVLKPKARKRAAAQAEQAKKAMHLKEEEVEAKVVRALKPRGGG